MKGWIGDDRGGASALVAKDTRSLSLVSRTRAIARAHAVASASGAAVSLGLGVALVATGVAADTRHMAAAAPPPLRIAQSAPIVAPEPADRPVLTPAIAVAPVEPHDLNCLSEAVYFEARGEPLSGQAAVAQVVLNRVGKPAFAGSVCGVVYQGAHGHGCQFSFACDGEVRRRHEEAAWSQARFIAARALSGYVMPQVLSATYFHVASLGRVWGPRMAPVAHVGHHIFYAPGGRPELTHAYQLLQASAKRGQAPSDAPQLRGPEPAPATVQTTAATLAPPPPAQRSAS